MLVSVTVLVTVSSAHWRPPHESFTLPWCVTCAFSYSQDPRCELYLVSMGVCMCKHYRVTWNLISSSLLFARFKLIYQRHYFAACSYPLLQDGLSICCAMLYLCCTGNNLKWRPLVVNYGFEFPIFTCLPLCLFVSAAACHWLEGFLSPDDEWFKKLSVAIQKSFSYYFIDRF